MGQDNIPKPRSDSRDPNIKLETCATQVVADHAPKGARVLSVSDDTGFAVGGGNPLTGKSVSIDIDREHQTIDASVHNGMGRDGMPLHAGAALQTPSGTLVYGSDRKILHPVGATANKEMQESVQMLREVKACRQKPPGP